MISALSSGPPADSWVYRSSTSAGRPHLTEPSSSKYAGQSRNVIWPSNPVAAHPRRREAAPSAPASPPGPAERIAASRDPDDAVGRVRTLALAPMTTARGREILSGNHQHRQGPRQPPWHVLLLHTRPGSPVHPTDAGRRNGTTPEQLGMLIRRHRADDSVTEAIVRILRADLVVVDDIGLLPVGPDAAEGLYRLADAAYEKRSVACPRRAGRCMCCPGPASVRSPAPGAGWCRGGCTAATGGSWLIPPAAARKCWLTCRPPVLLRQSRVRQGDFR